MLFRNFLLISLVLAGFTTTSQELKNKFGEVYYTSDLYKKGNEFVEGSPYLDVQFKPARINDSEATKLVRFDALNHRVEVHVRANSVMILDDAEPYTISLLDGSNKVYVNGKYRDDKGAVKRSFFLRHRKTDQFCLLEKEEIKFYKSEKAQGYQDRKPPQYKKERSIFYLQHKKKRSNELVALPTRAKKFVGLFPDRSKELRDFIKNENLDLYLAEDLIEVLDYYFGS
jgi:hypothetical protein